MAFVRSSCVLAVTFLLGAACGSPAPAASDAALTDAGTAIDASMDAPIDASVDAPLDASLDAPVDTSADASPDASLDASPADAGADATPDDPLEIRIVTANLTSGNNQRYEAPGIRILQGLRPDIVLMQEFNHGDNQAATMRAFVDSTFGTTYDFFRESAVGIPNAVISRYPILEAGVFDDPTLTDRELVWARIDVPGDKDLWAISVHLKASAGSSSTRQAEAVALVVAVRAKIPEADYLVIGGDLNTQSLREPCLSELAQLVAVGEPFPVDQLGDRDSNGGRSRPDDWVLFDAELSPLEIPVVVGASTYAHGLVFDSRVYTPLSEASPVLVDDSGVTGMQHMAVVRDVRLPAPLR